ncbi:MAG: amphi-Trp domain-containing protein [Gammaproteobacteria bacterium]|jgi:amphi-Trp domain-containing protein
MKHDNHHFLHESIQDRDTIAELLTSLQQGLSTGTLSFSDENNTITLNPSGLLNLTIEASGSSELNVLDVRISWQENKAGKLRNKISISTDAS